jgi:hypothetical protein
VKKYPAKSHPTGCPPSTAATKKDRGAKIRIFRTAISLTADWTDNGNSTKCDGDDKPAECPLSPDA